MLDLLYNSKASNYWPQGNNKENINNKYNYIRRNLPYVLKERDKSRLLEVKDDLEMMLKTGVGPVSPSDLVHESVDNAITSNVTSNNNNNNSLLINNDDSTLNNYQGLSTNETTSHNIQNHHNSPNDTFFKNTKTNKNNNYDDNTNNNNTKTKKNNKTNKSKYGALNNARTLWGNDEDYEEDGDDEDYSFHGKKPKKRAKLDHVEKKSKEMVKKKAEEKKKKKNLKMKINNKICIDNFHDYLNFDNDTTDNINGKINDNVFTKDINNNGNKEKNKTHVDNGYDNNGDAEEEENEQCQHSNCLRPTSSIVNWVCMHSYASVRATCVR